MVESGLVLSDSLDILVDQQANKHFKEVLQEVSDDIKNGFDLASALKKHPDVFPQLYCSLVKAGEESGKLDTVLSQMALNLERDREFRSKVRGAMIYPVVVFSLMIIVIIIMMIFVVPRLTFFFSQSNLKLPIYTQILIGTSNFMVSFWWLLTIIGIGLYILFRRWISTPNGKFQFDLILLKIPVVGKVIRGTSLTNFTRTFGLLIHAGLPILDSLVIVASIVGNRVYERALEDCFKGVERGLTLSAQLENTNAFPKIVSQMFRVGEETGKVDQISFKLAEYFESETDHLVKNLTVIIEPVVLVILGLGVAFLIISLILPIYQLSTSV
jgi:type IV pilus assembly protein PilC